MISLSLMDHLRYVDQQSPLIGTVGTSLAAKLRPRILIRVSIMLSVIVHRPSSLVFQQTLLPLVKTMMRRPVRVIC